VRAARSFPLAGTRARIREPRDFIVDDVAFSQPEHGLALAREVERRNVRKQYELETRGEV
jgi:hypothetical protein